MPTKTAPIEPCTLHGVRHRPGQPAAIACEALTAKATAAEPATPGQRLATVTPLRHFTAEPVVVTPEDLQLVLTGRHGALRLRRLAPGRHVATVIALNLGELVADAQGVRELLDVFGGDLEAAAADLTGALQLEQRLDTAA